MTSFGSATFQLVHADCWIVCDNVSCLFFHRSIAFRRGISLRTHHGHFRASRHFRAVHLLMYLVHNGRKKIFCFFGGGDCCSTPVVAKVGLALDQSTQRPACSVSAWRILASFFLIKQGHVFCRDSAQQGDMEGLGT